MRLLVYYLVAFSCFFVVATRGQWWGRKRPKPTSWQKPDHDYSYNWNFSRTTASFWLNFPILQPRTTQPPPINNGNSAYMPCGYNYYTETGGSSSFYMSSQRIIGGEEARVNEFPYQARITFNGQFICGGSLISNRHILTAAHCIVGPTSGYSVILGDHNKNSYETGEQTYTISKLTVHPRNSYRSNAFDFAILTTRNDIAFDRKLIRPVCLPASSLSLDSLVGQTGLISGWGKLRENGYSPATLQKGNVPILSQSECIRSYGQNSITNDMMCAGYKSGGVDSCQGDSGGPLVIVSNGRFYLQGVTSWGEGCGNRNYPGVYGRVATVVDWIKSTMASSY